MKYQIIGKNIVVTDAISSSIQTKLSKMDKYFDPREEVNCRAVVRSYPNAAKVEVTITTKDTTLRAEVKDFDLYAAVDLAVDRLVGQMRKIKTRLQKRHERNGIGKAILYQELQDLLEETKESQIVRTKALDLKPITLDEAIIEMEAIDHDFYLYLDTDDERICVVYRRKDGGYGLLQADNEVKIK